MHTRQSLQPNGYAYIAVVDCHRKRITRVLHYVSFHHGPEDTVELPLGHFWYVDDISLITPFNALCPAFLDLWIVISGSMT